MKTRRDQPTGQIHRLHSKNVEAERAPVPAHRADRAALREARARVLELEESLRFTRRVLDSLFAFVGVLELDGTLVEMNEAPLAAAGVTFEDVRGKKFWDCSWWDHTAEVREEVREACARAARGEVVRHDVPIRAAGDMRRTIDLQIAPLRDAEGHITHLIPSAVDVTERRQAEEALRRSERQLDRLFQTHLLGVLYWDMRGGVHDANDEFLRIIGASREDLEAGRIDWAAMTPPEYRAQDARALEELRSTGVHAPIEKEYVRRDGSRVWILVGSAVIEGETGVGFVLDITARKHAEQALRESEVRARTAAENAEAERSLLDAILQAAPVGIVVADAKGKLLRMNPANERLWGPAPLSRNVDEYQEWKGFWADGSERHGRRILPEEWALARAIRGEIAPGDVVEIEPFNAPGMRRTMVNSGAPVRDAAGNILGGVIAQMDITARLSAEQALRDSEQRFSTLANNMAQLAWMADADGSIVWYNQRWYEYTGTTFEDMKGWGWKRVHDAAELPRVESGFRRAIASGEVWEDTFPLRSKDGEYRWFLSRAMPVRDEAGRVVRWFGTNTDIEEQRRQAAALQEAIHVRDTFLHVAAHELRTPLTALRLQLEGLKRQFNKEGDGDAKANRKVEMATRQTERLGRLIEDLLNVTRIASGRLHLEPEPLDLAGLVRETVERLSDLAERSGCEIRVTPDEVVLGTWDRSRIEQVVTNLLTNAIKYGRGRPVDITIVPRDGWVELCVRDHGIGIAEPDQKRIFDRFERAVSSDHYGGLGLGLYIAREIVQAHGGTIEVQSSTGQGATFVVRLPLVAQRRPERGEGEAIALFR